MNLLGHQSLESKIKQIFKQMILSQSNHRLKKLSNVYMKLKDKICVLLTVLYVSIASSQNYKNNVSVVVFNADFIGQKVDVKDFKQVDKYLFTFENDKHKKHFQKEKIIYMPTLLLFNNGEELIRIEAGIDLKLPDNYKNKIQNKLEELLQNKF